MTIEKMFRFKQPQQPNYEQRRNNEFMFVIKGYASLAQYNSEVARGLVHTTEWVEKMKETKRRYDEEYFGNGSSTKIELQFWCQKKMQWSEEKCKHKNCTSTATRIKE